ncbi:hypothetical protein YC2023_073233 [Brassica napus]
MEILVRMSSIVVCLLVSSAVLFLLSLSSVQGLRYGPPRRFFNGTDQSSDLGSGKAFKNGMREESKKVMEQEEAAKAVEGKKETAVVATEEMGVQEMGEEEVVEAKVEDEAAAKEMENVKEMAVVEMKNAMTTKGRKEMIEMTTMLALVLVLALALA